MKNNNEKKSDILIIGSIPPPIGGVTIYVKRLLNFLKEKEQDFVFFNLNDNKVITIFYNILIVDLIHLNTSNVYLRFIISFFCYLTNKKLIITYHGNLGRYNKNKNRLDYLSVKFSTIPIVLNEASYIKSKCYNKNALKVTSFIPLIYEEKLNQDLYESLTKFISKFNDIYCSNAYKFVFDKNQNEIYGINQLIDIFKDINSGLIISDPSGTYSEYFKNNNITIPDNIFIINYNHSFYEIIKISDVFIRNTTTDGDSISIKEALCLGKIVLSTDVVQRPEGVLKYKLNDKEKLIYLIKNYKKHSTTSFNEHGGNDILKIYKSQL